MTIAIKNKICVWIYSTCKKNKQKVWIRWLLINPYFSNYIVFYTFAGVKMDVNYYILKMDYNDYSTKMVKDYYHSSKMN